MGVAPFVARSCSVCSSWRGRREGTRRPRRAHARAHGLPRAHRREFRDHTARTASTERYLFYSPLCSSSRCWRLPSGAGGPLRNGSGRQHCPAADADSVRCTPYAHRSREQPIADPVAVRQLRGLRCSAPTAVVVTILDENVAGKPPHPLLPPIAAVVYLVVVGVVVNAAFAQRADARRDGASAPLPWGRRRRWCIRKRASDLVGNQRGHQRPICRLVQRVFQPRGRAHLHSRRDSL